MIKTDRNIIKRIESIENSTFTEDDIKLLLIEIRGKLRKENFLTEICHFVAHSERDKGICHKKIDVRYAKLKFLEESIKSKLTTEFIVANRDKPEHFFTDLMLSYIDAKKIDKNIFDLIIIGGIDDIENQLFVKYYKQNRKQVKRLIKSTYELIGDAYVIKKSISKREYLYIDDLLKFIRGTITGKPAFTKNEIQNDFVRAIKRLSTELNYNLNIKSFKKNIDDVILTIMALLQDAQFKLYDGEKGHSFLSLHPSKNGFEIYLMGKSGKTSLPLIGTNLKASNYIDFGETEIEQFSLSQIPWTTIDRNNKGKIELIKNKE